jgi:hypothetical protein
MIATINDRDGISMRLRVPRLGAWHVTECEVGTGDAIAEGDTATISIDGQMWVGTVTDSHTFTNRTTLQIVGGAGGLSKKVPSQHYLTPSPELVIRSVLSVAGEALDSSSSVPATKLPHWVGFESKASQALTAICDKAGLVWRVLPNGKIWVGTETWPTVEPEGVEIQDEDWSDGSIIVAGEFFAELQKIAPGTTFDGHQIEQVEHRIDGLRVRTIPQITSLDSAAKEFLASVRREMDHALPYPCKVVAQNADGTLQLMPEDPRMPSHGLDGIRICPGLPGWTIKVSVGARVRVCFDNGDRSQPYATAWDLDDKVTSLSYLGGTRPFARVGDPVQVFLGVGSTFIFAGTFTTGPAAGSSCAGTVTCTITSPSPGIISAGQPKLLG